MVQRSPGWLAINVQLLRSPAETPLWTRRFDDQESHALQLQSDVAEQLANELERAIPVKLTALRLEKSQAVKPEALALYFEGHAHVSRENRKDNDTAIELLEKAKAADPGFADAYAELANAYVVKDFYFEPNRWRSKAQAAVDTALSLNPDSAQGHFAKGHLLWTPSPSDFPHEKAIQELRRAVTLKPNLDEAHQWLAAIYLHIGLLDQALAEARKAVAINPANFMAHYRIGVALHLQGRYQEGLATLEPIPDETNPELLGRQIPWTLFQLKKNDEARSRIKKFRDKYNEDTAGQLISLEAMLDASEGKQPEAEKKIERVLLQKPRPGHFHHAAYNVACAYALLGKTPEAVQWLKEAADTGFPCYPLFATDPSLDLVRTDAQFLAFEAEQKQRWEGYKAAFGH